MKFTVKDAGEVEIQRDGDQLTLVDVRANEGWEIEEEAGGGEVEEEEEADDLELEVTFVQGDREVEFEAEIDEGRLAIEIEETVRNVEPGTFQVGEAGDVEFRREGDRLILVGVIANDGWDFEAEHEDDDDEAGIEISFVSGDRQAEFEATIEDGILEVEIETKEYVD